MPAKKAKASKKRKAEEATTPDQSAKKARVSPGVRVAVVASGMNGGGIGFLMGKRQEAHGQGTWFFPSDTMNPNESVLDCVCRVLVEQTGMTVDSKRASYWGDVVILDNMPTQPMLFLEDKYKDSKQPAEEEDATLTVFVYCNCATTDPKAKVERDKHGNDVPASPQPEVLDNFTYFGWSDLAAMCGVGYRGTGKVSKSKVPFQPLVNFMKKYPDVDWDRAPWPVNI